MIKLFFFVSFLLFSLLAFAQGKFYWKSVCAKTDSLNKWVENVNRLVGPKYVLLKEPYNDSYYEEIDIDKNGQKEVVVSVMDTIERTTNLSNRALLNKIFVFKIIQNSLRVIDSSSEYETDGRGPQIMAKKDSLIITHSFHRGQYKYIYKFNKKAKKYLLSSIELFELLHFKKSPSMNDFWHYHERFDVKSKLLTIESGNKRDSKEREIWSKRKKIFRKIPSTFSLKLSGFRDPLNYDKYLSPLLKEDDQFKKYFKY